MKRLVNILKGLWQILARITCAAAAIFLMQVPVYIDQYVDILTHARAEAQPTYESTQRKAFQRNFSPEAFLEAAELEVQNKDSLQLVVNTFERYQTYDEQINAINGASIWKKPIIFSQVSEKKVREAMEFKPGLNDSWESLIYGLVGILLATILLNLLVLPFRRRQKAEEG